jgi:diguanylate cyclase (GGDEF)-like protein
VIQKPAVRQLGLLLGLAVVYTAAGKLGLRLGIVNPSASPVWAPTGIAIAAFVLGGARYWPAIFAGAFFYNVTTAGSLATSFGIATGNTLEGLVGAVLVRRWANGADAFKRGQDVVRFAALAGLGATTISPTIGVTSLALGGFALWRDYGPIWLTWWLGDASGALLVAPPLLLWGVEPRVHWALIRVVEAAALFTVLLLLGVLSFGPLGGPALGFLCIPALIWAALRFQPRVAATAVTLVSTLAIAETVSALRDLSRDTQNDQLLLLQTFMAVTSVTILVLAAVVAERRRGEKRLRELATTDALTGLANYRQLLGALEAEVQRSQRTERPFALLFFDLDDLKRVNDSHGHLVGSRALCRFAESIRLSCRAIDTPARYGGDEFALILPETDESKALGVALRVRARLAADAEDPPVSASVGVAMYPRDGDTVDRLLAAADRALDGMKRGRGIEGVTPVDTTGPGAR